MHLTFSALADTGDGSAWAGAFHRLWPAYRRWYLAEGEDSRPTYLECRRALRRYMPALVPDWERLVELVGGGDLEARFLSLYTPPAYLSGCSQAVWPGPEPLLVRNYDYDPRAFDALALHTTWSGRSVMGSSDCLVGLVDGLNDAGLAVSLTFGGRRIVGAGFGAPMLLRYLLQTCESAPEAGRLLERIPTHMAYNVTVLDRQRRCVTAFLSPDRAAVLSNTPVATNHQDRIEWASHARTTATVERERFLLQRLMLHEDPEPEFIAAFLRPPLYSLAFDRGFGTLYTAAYWPSRGEMVYRWPDAAWHLRLDNFTAASREIRYPTPAAVGNAPNPGPRPAT